MICNAQMAAYSCYNNASTKKAKGHGIKIGIILSDNLVFLYLGGRSNYVYVVYEVLRLYYM